MIASVLGEIQRGRGLLQLVEKPSVDHNFLSSVVNIFTGRLSHVDDTGFTGQKFFGYL